MGWLVGAVGIENNNDWNIRWDERPVSIGMRYAPNNRRARSTRERRPAVKKTITVQKIGTRFQTPQLTIGGIWEIESATTAS